MRTLSATILMVVFIGSACSRKDAPTGDDVADAKAAFATMVEYQKTDDIRTTNLYSPDFILTCTLLDVNGKSKKTFALTPEEFHKILMKEIASKRGSTEIYKAVTFSKNGTNVTVTAKVNRAGSTNEVPVSLTYGRDSDGVLRIQTMHITEPPHRQ